MKSQVERVFHEVADLSAADRTRYYDDHDVSHKTRWEVEALLAFDSGSNTVLERDISGVAKQALLRFESAGSRCGSYLLGEALGRGGMGTVYLARRVDGEVTQDVAVKLLQPGADALQLRARFLSERQILANLSHPNIARLLDAGHREDGQPYLVMEYVAGRSIDAYCEKLTLRRRIALFVKVCSAVAYLHRNLVVHRDLKPANILVTEDDEPKLLDFGIAKILDWSNDSTVTAMRMLTPDYASPEQVMGGPITTATDIYSLGAVLYKLLTGVPPHQFQGESPASMPFEIAFGKITPPSKLEPEVNGDLDVVLMKALRTEPQARYSSVDAFADDLRACLEWRPVQARSGDAWYQTRRWLRRYWLTAAAAGLVVASLSGGLYVANRQRAIAERRFAQLRQLSKRMIDLDRAIRLLPGSVDARQRLVSASLEYLEGLSADARGNLDLTQEVSEGYWRLARIQGVNAEPNLGDTQKAEQSLKKADALIEAVLASRPRDRNALFRSAVIAADRLVQANSEDRSQDQLVHSRKAADRLQAFLQLKDSGHPVHLEGFLRDGDAREAELTGSATLYTNLAVAYVNIHMYREGAQCARQAVGLARSIPTARDVAGQALSVLANALRYQGDLDGGLAAIREAREFLKQASYPGETARLFAIYGVMVREGRILGEEGAVNAGRPAQAVQVLQQALDLVESAARKDPSDSASRARVATSARELGDVLSSRDPARALAVYDLGIQRLGEMRNSLKARRDHAQLLANSSYPLRRLHRGAESKARIDAAFDILKELKDYPADRIPLGSYDYAIICALADHEADSGSPGRALQIYDDLLRRVVATAPKPQEILADAVTLSHVYKTMAELARRVGQYERACTLEEQCVDIWRNWDAKLPKNSYVRGQLTAATLRADSHWAERAN
jgi:serine/threonine protein kinase